VRSNCISPAARTRLTEGTPGLGDMIAPPDDAALFDVWDPANVSPLAAYLATEECTITGRTFFIQGGTIRVMEGWSMGERLERDDRWTVEALAKELPSISE
jgi:hypothetical protein